MHIFQQTPLGCFLARLGDSVQQELLDAYARDFLLLTTRVSSDQELMVGIWQQMLAEGVGPVVQQVLVCQCERASGSLVLL